jgi:hypothetical protein
MTRRIDTEEQLVKPIETETQAAMAPAIARHATHR